MSHRKEAMEKYTHSQVRTIATVCSGLHAPHAAVGVINNSTKNRGFRLKKLIQKSHKGKKGKNIASMYSDLYGLHAYVTV